jgi:putative phosphoribosyl transferase
MSPRSHREISIPVDDVVLHGDLYIPSAPDGVVLFAHGSGSSRLSPRNRFVASQLSRRLATLLIDLLSPEEELRDARAGELRFDIELLARRLVGATEWLATDPVTRDLAIGYFGSSTGAAAALEAAAAYPNVIGAVVSRGGRPDLAGPALRGVYAPTLLIVGGADTEVLQLNEVALAALQGPKRLEVIEGASHLFPEPGALEEVADLARAWFEEYLKLGVPAQPLAP